MLNNKYLKLQQQRVFRLLAEDVRSPVEPDLSKYEPKRDPAPSPGNADQEAYPHFIRMSQSIQKIIQDFVQKTSPILGVKRANNYVTQVLQRELEAYGWNKLHH